MAVESYDVKQRLHDEDLDMLYRTLMADGPDPRVEEASEAVYKLIMGSPDFMRLEESINAYTAAAERRGFIEGLKAGLRLDCEYVTGEGMAPKPEGALEILRHGRSE